ncbi:MAG: hypothetical protein ABW047_17245 [Nitrospiraceae bacterium]
MNVRTALIFLMVGLVGLWLVMGVLSFIRWVRTRYPRRGVLVLMALCLIVVGAAIVIAMEMRERPSFRPNDLLTLQEPVVAKTIAADRSTKIETCVIDRYEHLGVLEVEGGRLTVRVESNNTSAPVYCPIGTDVRTEVAWLHSFTVTRRTAQ